jgi:hypothetical protein
MSKAPSRNRQSITTAKVMAIMATSLGNADRWRYTVTLTWSWRSSGSGGNTSTRGRRRRGSGGQSHSMRGLLIDYLLKSSACVDDLER